MKNLKYCCGYLNINGSGLKRTRFWLIFSLFRTTIFLPQHDPPLPNTICMKGQDLKRDIKREIHEEKENIKTEIPEMGENVEGSTHY